MQNLLQGEGIESKALQSGVKALEHMAELIYSRKPIYKVLFIDFCMSGLDGPQTAIQVKELCEDAGRQVPFMVCISAYTEASF